MARLTSSGIFHQQSVGECDVAGVDVEQDEAGSLAKHLGDLKSISASIAEQFGQMLQVFL